MNRAFWKGKKVFLTGHTGFKGSWASIWLNKLGAHVFGYSLTPPTNPSLFEAAGLKNIINHRIGDVRNYRDLSEALLEAKPDIVIHMAAQPLVRYSYDFPIETYETNVMGVVNLLESIRRCSSVKAVVNVTTDKCYENREWSWGYRENESMGGYDPYSSSKGCAELVTSAMRRSYFNGKGNKGVANIGSARAGNVIGGGDWAKDRLVPDMVQAFANKTPVVIRNPKSTRPWQHVLEPLSGYFTLAEFLYDAEDGYKYADGWNFGPRDEDAKDVQYLVQKLSQQWGDGASWKLDLSDHPHEANFLKLDISKARNYLHWTPTWGVDEALRQTCEWYKSYYADSSKAMSVCLQQIEKYESEICHV